MHIESSRNGQKHLRTSLFIPLGDTVVMDIRDGNIASNARQTRHLRRLTRSVFIPHPLCIHKKTATAGGFDSGARHSRQRLKMSEVLTPPKAKLLFITTSVSMARASSRMKST